MANEVSGQQALELLSMLRAGGALYDLAKALDDAAQAVEFTRKPATITVKLTVEHQGGALIVRDTVTAKVPREIAEPTVVYRDPSGRFTRRDPRQPTLPVVGAVMEETGS